MKIFSLLFLWIFFIIFLIGEILILANVGAIAWIFLIPLFILFDTVFLFIAIAWTFSVGIKEVREVK
ncbi:MAG: hypothetical protein C0175_05570 [Caldisericum exile]|uniref:Uncharacterized protein n=1 Tax=Caldisericum exile TaxID=693075 RepID=A0A2J6X4M7_9BACT|nr:MAG: hypothetical protein C0175_05570 [Caldisericum exile]